MSVIVSGPRRVYVLLFLCRRVADACASCHRAVSAAEHALGADGQRRGGRDCGSLCRLVMAVRLHRVLWRRVAGVSLLVLDPQPAGGQ